MLATTQSMWPPMQTLLMLTLVETVVKVWIGIGIGFLLTSVSAIVLLVLKQTNGHNST